jgi:hypothetical protein
MYRWVGRTWTLAIIIWLVLGALYVLGIWTPEVR